MRNLVTITTPFRDQTVLQQHDGSALLALEGTVELEDERNYPVIRVVNERTEETELYEPLAFENGRWAHTLRLPTGMHRIETGVELAQAGYNPFYLGHGDMLRSVFVGEVFAIAGQSNAAGYGKGEVCDPPQYGVSVFDAGWRTAAHPIGQTKASAAYADALNCGHSAWLSFGKKILEQTGSPVGLVPAALNGSGIRSWQPGEPLFCLKRIRMADLEPIAIERVWISLKRFPKLPDYDYSETSLYEVLRVEYGLEAGYSRQKLNAVMVEGEDAQILFGAKKGVAMRMRNVDYDKNLRPIAAADSIYHGTKYTFDIVI